MRELVLLPRRYLKSLGPAWGQSLVEYGGPASPTLRCTSLEVASGLIGVRMHAHVACGVPHTKAGGDPGLGSSRDGYNLSSWDAGRQS